MPEAWLRRHCPLYFRGLQNRFGLSFQGLGFSTFKLETGIAGQSIESWSWGSLILGFGASVPEPEALDDLRPSPKPDSLRALQLNGPKRSTFDPKNPIIEQGNPCPTAIHDLPLSRSMGQRASGPATWDLLWAVTFVMALLNGDRFFSSPDETP